MKIFEYDVNNLESNALTWNGNRIFYVEANAR